VNIQGQSENGEREKEETFTHTFRCQSLFKKIVSFPLREVWRMEGRKKLEKKNKKSDSQDKTRVGNRKKMFQNERRTRKRNSKKKKEFVGDNFFFSKNYSQQRLEKGGERIGRGRNSSSRLSKRTQKIKRKRKKTVTKKQQKKKKRHPKLKK